MSVSVAVQTALEPTEDESKVERALLKLFPSAHIARIAKPDDSVALSVRGNGLEFLSNLRNLIRQQRIRSAARLILTRSLRESPFQFHLNKQAAFMGRISFCEAKRRISTWADLDSSGMRRSSVSDRLPRITPDPR